MSYHTNYSGIRLHCLSVMIPNTQGLENGVYGSDFCFTQFSDTAAMSSEYPCQAVRQPVNLTEKMAARLHTVRFCLVR